jgi:uroporphyrinogen decarboxylase
MTSEERVMTALDFRQPDRVPVSQSFWSEFRQAWEREKGDSVTESIEDYYLEDVFIAVGDETPYCTRAEELGEDGDYIISRDGWGQTKRTKKGGYFYEQLSYAYDEDAHLIYGEFDPPDLPDRYERLDGQMADLKRRYCVFAKTGGPFIRTYFMRGEVPYLMDMGGDPARAAELTMRTAEHLTQIGLEELRRWDLYDTGVWIFDDMASAKGPMFSPATAEKVLAPAWQYMVDSFKAAGARKVIMHSDGNIGPLLDLFIDLGFDGINPVEYHTGLHPLALREQYGERLALLGGLDNAHILPRGDPAEVREHVLEVLAAGVDGGLVIGTHSVAPDISVGTMELVRDLVLEYGTYPMQLP